MTACMETSARVDPVKHLSGRQSELFYLLACGLTCREISVITGLTERTVNYYKLTLRTKFYPQNVLTAIRCEVKRNPEFKKSLIEEASCLLERLPEIVRITPREAELVQLIHKRPKEIGKALGISLRTVHFHYRTLFEKFRVRNRTELYLRLLSEGFLSY
ncbi:MAG: LuxR C-terminal-related transcriptional regulator [Deltaproteobacteria bacterium]|nr:LuxR C-terminal-related transcriptional regulator [Deltaproteobacteria bacterium]MCX7952601.1 LuxR C-terminal-related transcriptional regulator [Deltaproteobacteria bacterium]